MNDFVNALTIIVGCLIVGATIMRLKRRRRGAALGMLSAFVVGLAFHSLYLHERIRRGWKLWWDHD